MGVAYLLARMGDHRGAALNALAVAVAAILVSAPLAVFDPALTLTAGATLGILVGSARLGRCLPAAGWLRTPATLGLASVAAELALFPVAAFVFSRVTFAGLALNFAAIPLMTVAQVAGMAVLPLSALSRPAGLGAGFVAHLGAAGLVNSARLADYAPWLAMRVPPPSWLAIGGYYAGWAAWLGLPASVRARTTLERSLAVARRFGIAAVAASGLWILASPLRSSQPSGDTQLMVTFLDVGQADAALVRFPDGRLLLVDTGGQRGPSTFDVGSRVVAPALWAIGARRLDFLAISHGDPDHIGGALAVVRDFRPREIWEGVPVPPDALLGALRRGADRSGATWRTLRSGDTMTIGGVALLVWHPPPPDWERQRVRNDDSLVLELRYAGVSILLPGDIGADVERMLAPRLTPAHFRLLKVPHHGSASSSTRPFLAAARPDVAVLTAGRGTVVARDVLARYEEVSAALLRTDVDGAVTIKTDGAGVDIRTFSGARRTFQVAPAIPSARPPRP
jgi:competence protein ComEC